VPYSSLESVVEQSKEDYYRALRRTQGTIRAVVPDWNPWIEFFLHALQQQKRNLERKIEHEQIVLGNLPEISVQILEFTRERGRVTIAEAVKLTGQSRGTVRDHVKALTKAGHLTPHGAGRGAWYGLT
jgi:Fic family protein